MIITIVAIVSRAVARLLLHART